MLKLFCFLTGDDYNLVKVDTPESKKKISALASVLLIPVVTWFIIGFSIGNVILRLSLAASFGIGIITATIIFIVERVVIMSGPNKWLIGLRVFIGLLVALLGSVFIDEVIFKDDIEQQVYLDKKEMIEHEKTRVHSRIDPLIQQAEEDVATKHHIWSQSLEDVKKEADGSGGSGLRKYGPIAKVKNEISERQSEEYRKASDKLAALQAELKQQVSQAENGINQNISGHSILFRIKSLFRLVLSDNWVLVIYLLFTALLFVLEFIVIIMKYSLPETSYERRVKTMELIQKRKLNMIADRQAIWYDSADSSGPVLQAENALGSGFPSLFRANS
jgi:hypothetical protein